LLPDAPRFAADVCFSTLPMPLLLVDGDAMLRHYAFARCMARAIVFALLPMIDTRCHIAAPLPAYADAILFCLPIFTLPLMALPMLHFAACHARDATRHRFSRTPALTPLFSRRHLRASRFSFPRARYAALISASDAASAFLLSRRHADFRRHCRHAHADAVILPRRFVSSPPPRRHR